MLGLQPAGGGPYWRYGGSMIQFDNSYARDLPGSFLRLAPDLAPAPRVLALNTGLAAELGLQIEDAAGWFSGAVVPEGADPIALAYAGHQFGGFSPQLGDGRAHLLGEFLGPDGRRWDLQLKGSGRTPFSRGGDGKAAVAPMLREYLISEAMAALRIPTTRSLAVVSTGEVIMRDQGPVPAAVLARVAASHIRVGTFQFFASRGEVDKLRALLDYSIARHYPQVHGPMEFFAAVVQAQARLVAQWMGVGFVHGVMNTDNMAISGETIDYGPCAFMEAYAPGTVFSSIDRQGRYSYGNQPAIMGWNLARLAESLLPFLDPDPDRAVDLANGALEEIAGIYRAEFLTVMRAKLALDGEAAGDGALVDDFLQAIQGVDWTLAHRRLAVAVADEAGYLALFDAPEAIKVWLPRWRARLRVDAVAGLLAANPAVIPRNHLVEAALDAASDGDMTAFEALLAALRDPFGSEAGREGFALPAPKGFEAYVTYCGT
jgi:serine/tyrosine/threonine adenylyltransferase